MIEEIDDTDRNILTELARDARLSLKDLAARVALSSPSTSERLRRLEERGVIRAYTVDVNLAAVGYSLQAIVRVKPLPGKLHLVQKLIEDTPQFCECDKVTGEDCFVVRLYLRAISELDPLLDRLSDMAETNTAIVKAQPVQRRLPPLG